MGIRTVNSFESVFSVYLRDLVKLAEEFVQHVHELAWGAVTGQPGEAHDVGVENAVKTKIKNTVKRKTIV